MRRFVVFCAMTVFLGVNALSAFAAPYKEEYKLDLNPNAQTAWGKGAQYFCDIVKERSKGRINIRPYFNSQLSSGKQTSSLMLLRNGAADFSMQAVFNWAPQIVEYNIFGMPFLMNSYEEIDAVRGGKAGKMLIAATNSKGVKFLAWGENGYRVLTNNKREVRKPEDLAGMKVRVVGSTAIIDTFKALGANPINMNWSDVMSAIQQGVIDGQENPLNYLDAFKIYEFHKFYTDWRYIADALAFCINVDTMNSFTPEDQKLIQQAADDAMKYEIAMARLSLDDGQSMKYLKSINMVPELTDYAIPAKAAGAKIIRLTPEELQAFIVKTQPVRDDWKNKIGIDLYNAALEDMKSVKK